MKSVDLIHRYKKDALQGHGYAQQKFEENIIDYAKDKCITILMLSGMKHCDAGYLVNQHKKLFK